MFIEILKETAAYLKLLSEEHGFDIHINDFDGFTRNYREYFNPWYGKKCSYCYLLSSNELSYKHCGNNLSRVMENIKDGKGFYGMCYAGVECFVIPIMYQNKTLGFIAVNGYRSDDEKALPRLEHISKVYGFPKDLLMQKYQDLRSKPACADKIHVMFRVAARMLELAYTKIIEQDWTEKKIINKDNLCREIQIYIKMYYMTNISNKALSEFFHCSPSYITHNFKKGCGMTVNGYINFVRTQKAKELLENSHAPISNIALNVGYSDANYFSTVFKQISGITPRECRNSAI